MRRNRKRSPLFERLKSSLKEGIQFACDEQDLRTYQAPTSPQVKPRRKRAVKEVELTGCIVNSEVIFDTPAPLPVGKNTLYVGDTKVTLKLRVDGNDQ